jgi:hypothetical protein
VRRGEALRFEADNLEWRLGAVRKKKKKGGNFLVKDAKLQQLKIYFEFGFYQSI